METALPSFRTNAVKLLGYKTLGNAYYQLADHEGAARVWSAGAAAFDKDAELANNAAFILTKHLSKPAEALPLARRAVELSPNVPDFKDTLGVVLLENGKVDEALPMLQSAFDLAQRADTKVTTGVHLVRAMKEAGKVEDAKKIAETLDRVIAQSPDAFSPEIRGELQELRDAMK
jgi:Flp pilus assembly protein TadD